MGDTAWQVWAWVEWAWAEWAWPTWEAWAWAMRWVAMLTAGAMEMAATEEDTDARAAAVARKARGRGATGRTDSGAAWSISSSQGAFLPVLVGCGGSGCTVHVCLSGLHAPACGVCGVVCGAHVV